MPLPDVIDRVVQGCPIDTRRALYGNITLSGGSTMFKHFGHRIQVGGRGGRADGGTGGQAGMVRPPWRSLRKPPLPALMVHRLA